MFKAQFNPKSVGRKQCSKCGETKPVEAFYFRSASKDGFTPTCKTCNNRKDKQRGHDFSRRYQGV